MRRCLTCGGNPRWLRVQKLETEILALCSMCGAENEICLDGELSRQTVLVQLYFFMDNNAKTLLLHLSSFSFFIHHHQIHFREGNKVQSRATTSLGHCNVKAVLGSPKPE